MRTVLILLAVLTLSSCGVFGGGAADEPPRPERDTLRVGVGNAIDTAPLRIAVAAGEFSRAGLKIELVEQQSEDDGLAKLQAGELDVAFASDVALFRAANDGMPLCLQGEAYTAGQDTMALMTLPGADYQEVSAKQAPTIAIEPRDELGMLASRSVVATAGVDPGQVQFTERPRHELIAAVGSGEADAAWLVEPHITNARKEYGARVLSDGARGATLDFPVSSYASSKAFATANQVTLTAFRNALGAAQARAEDPAVVRNALPALAEIDSTTAALISLGSYPSSLNAIRLQRVADLMHAAGSIPDRLDVQSLLPGSRAP